MDNEDFYKEHSEEHENKEDFEKESATAAISYDVEVDQGNIQFEIHHNDNSSDSDGVAEGLEGELRRRNTESSVETDSGAEARVDSEEEKADSEEEKADSGAEEADSGAEEADSGAEEVDSGSHYEYNDPLYVGAGITVSVAMTLLLAFIVHYRLTSEVIADLL